MMDTKGSEIRLGDIEEGTVLQEGHKVTIATEETEGDSKRISVNYKEFTDHIEAGDEVRIDDGKIELKVDKVNETAECTVIYGGEISSRKAVNVPGKDIGLQAPTEKDRRDIEFGAEKGYDFVSLSFVKEASDAIMVARGDLGVELPAPELPMMQKEMIKKSNRAGKPVITATQMLESMTENPTATRAEISDVANAVIDGTDAVMLSGETAIGDYPVKTAEFMSRVVEETEASIKENVHHTVKDKSDNTREIICKNVWQASRDSEADIIVAHTSSGSTARNISKYRPENPIIAFTDSEMVERQLALSWGVRPYYEEFPGNVEEMLENSAQRLENLGLVNQDDKVVMSAGIPTTVTGTTNMMQIRKIGKLLE